MNARWNLGKQRDISSLYVLHASDLDPVDNYLLVHSPRVSPSSSNRGGEMSTKNGLGHSMPRIRGQLSPSTPQRSPPRKYGGQGAGIVCSTRRKSTNDSDSAEYPSQTLVDCQPGVSRRYPSSTNEAVVFWETTPRLEQFSTEDMARGPKRPKCLWQSQASGTGDSTEERDHIEIIWGEWKCSPWVSANRRPDEPHLGGGWLK